MILKKKKIVISGLFPSRAYFYHRFPVDVSEKNKAVSQWLLADSPLPAASSAGWE